MNQMGVVPCDIVNKIVIHSKTDLEIFSRMKMHWLEIIDNTEMLKVIKWIKEKMQVNILLAKSKNKL